MLIKSLKMNKIDRNVSELWQIVCKRCNFNIVDLLVLFCELSIGLFQFRQHQESFSNYVILRREKYILFRRRYVWFA